MPLQHTPNRTCKQCEGRFYKIPSDIARGRGRFCSATCRDASNYVPLADRFWFKVNKDGSIPEHRPELGPCWIWTAGCNSSGYGYIRPGGSILPNKGAHCISWEIHVGPIPDGLDVCHHCDNKVCVRPSHLFLGTSEENNRDKHVKGRDARGAANGAYTHPERRPAGERHGQAKLTVSKVAEIRLAYRPMRGEFSRLAALHGVSRHTIARVVREECWTGEQLPS